MRTIGALLAAVMTAAGVASATTGEFLGLGAGARASSLGEAYTAAAADATAITWNPAGLGRVQGTALTLMHASLLADSSYEYAAAACRIGAVGTVGLALQYQSADAITMRDAAGAETGSLTPADLSVAGAYGRETVMGVLAGFAVKYVSSELVDAASTVTFDVGLVSPGITARDIRVGLAVANLGGSLTFDQEDEDLPMTVRVGAAATFLPGLLTAVDAAFPKDQDMVFGVGVEYGRAIAAGVAAALRAGYNTRTTDVDGLKGVTLGLGATWKGLGVDYGFEPAGDLGTAHRVSLNYAFGHASKTAAPEAVPVVSPVVEPVPAAAPAPEPTPAPASPAPAQ